MISLWTERYRPHTIEEFVWASPNLKTSVNKWIADKEIPNVLFTGGAGRGKTSLARLLMNELRIPKCDILDKNASLDNKVNAVKDIITSFTSSWAMGETGIKYVILDEADRLSAHSQDFLRGEIEQHAATCRFILTGNNRNKFTEPLHSRFQEFEFPALEHDEAVMRCATILVKEGVEFEPEVLIQYVNAFYPDLRKCINVLQQRSVTGRLDVFTKVDVHTDEYLMELLTFLVSGDAKSARKVLNEQTTPEDYLTILRFIFTNVGVFPNDDSQDNVLIAVRDCIWRHDTVADKEINMAATMVEIARAARK